MENVSKAIIIAGSILIAIIIISLLVIVFGKTGDLRAEKEKSLSIEQLEKYNRKFNTFDRSLYGSELLSLANLIDDYNKRILYAENATGTFYNENKFTVTVSLNKDIIGYNDENGKKKGKYSIEDIKAYNDGLEERIKEMEEAGWNKKDSPNYEDYIGVKSLLTELRSMPFKCNSSETEYNKYGRISKMHFEQQSDTIRQGN